LRVLKRWSIDISYSKGRGVRKERDIHNSFIRGNKGQLGRIGCMDKSNEVLRVKEMSRPRRF